MKYVLVSVFDRAVQCYNVPMCVRSPGEAVRAFRDEVNNAESRICKHPSDYELYVVANFDDEKGMMLPGCDGPALLVRGEDCVEVKHVA